ncbi:MAG: alpha/beta fold hydrolase [Candidatus Aenigmarchaeota archaeon]|nr:alpha/beta fold hydrolase [Candidatus Aenigmarchaeota archaeon]
MKKVSFQNGRGQKLAGILHEADSDKVVILLHGFGGDKDEQGIFVRTAENLNKNGFSALRFDFAGSGESEGEFSEMSFSSGIEDLNSAIEFVKNKGYKKIGLVGQSFGGAVSILGYSKSIQTMVLWNPVSKVISFENYLSSHNRNWKGDLKTKGFCVIYKYKRNKFLTIGKKLLDEVEKLDILSEARKISCPVLVIHGDKDSVLPWKNSLELLKVLKEPKKLEIVKVPSMASMTLTRKKSLLDLTVNWFKKYL